MVLLNLYGDAVALGPLLDCSSVKLEGVGPSGGAVHPLPRHGGPLPGHVCPPPVPVGPINREMRHLISSLQNHNHQLKGDVQRYKRKLREVQAEINKVGGATGGWAGPPGVWPL